MRTWDGYFLGLRCAKRLMHLVACKSRKFVANFDYSMSAIGISQTSQDNKEETYSSGSMKKPMSSLYTTGQPANSFASSGDSCIWARTQHCKLGLGPTTALAILHAYL